MTLVSLRVLKFITYGSRNEKTYRYNDEFYNQNGTPAAAENYTFLSFVTHPTAAGKKHLRVNKNKLNFEQLFFDYVHFFQMFISQLQSTYSLIDHPYNVSGKIFPKIGNILVNQKNIRYRFHGKGCTIYWDGLEIFFNIAISRKSDILIVTPGGWICFLRSYFPAFGIIEEGLDPDNMLFEFEKKGMITKDTNYNFFYVKDNWYNNIIPDLKSADRRFSS